MSQQFRKDPKPTAAPPGATADRKSGRVRFDERGQAVWEWAVQTGMFDRNASTQRIRALTEAPVKLEIADAAAEKPAAPKPASGNPYERAARAQSGRREPAGGDPYSRGPARSPESMNFNPYERSPSRQAPGARPAPRTPVRKP
ncbi:MAG: hypothetical protein JSR54_11785 [Proteobacteria bacterium]|nr:hypothetical protein [Pseudomonadota bacterium]